MMMTAPIGCDRRRGPLSDEHREKIAAAQRGKPRPNTRKLTAEEEARRRSKIAAALRGRPLSISHRAKLAAAKLGRKRPDISVQMSLLHRGRPKSEEWRRKVSEANKGQRPTALCIENSRRARANGLNLTDEQRREKSRKLCLAWDRRQPERVTPINARIRASFEMKVWRERVFSRDEHTCQKCSKRGGDLHAHHIKPFCKFPGMRFDTSNGMTVCIPCHRAIHEGWRADKGVI